MIFNIKYAILAYIFCREVLTVDSFFSKIFIEIAECENITKAASKLGYTQSGLSHILNRAENELGFQLFFRSKSGVRLTNAGNELLPVARELSHSYEKMYETITSIQGIEKGHITIGTFTSISMNILPPVIVKFGCDYPGIKIDLREGSVTEIHDWIINRTVDVGFTSLHDTDEFECKTWFEDPLLAVVPKYFDIKDKYTFDIQDFNNYPFIMPSTEKGNDYDIDRLVEKHNLKLDIRLSSKSDMAILSMVENGLGISILPKLIVLNHNRNVKTLQIKPYSVRKLGMGFRSLEDVSPAALKFIEYAESIVKEIIKH